jgi:hypothetical protein
MNFENQQVPVSSSFLFLAHFNLVLSGFENRRASGMNCRRHERHPPFYFDKIHHQQRITFSFVLSGEGTVSQVDWAQVVPAQVDPAPFEIKYF